jgi:formylglycine-generating enzyme required for sulfatase activity
MTSRRVWAAALLVLAAFSMPAQAAGPGKGAKPGTVFKDCRDCPELVVIRPSRLKRGTDGGEKDRYEGPVREVNIGYAFAAGRFELTNGQYRRFVEATGHETAGTGCNVVRGDRVEAVPGTNWTDPFYGRPIRDDEPVACIRWSDAKSYVSWLAGRTGKKYRLLTEAEWEYAARAGTQGLYTWGDDKAAACKVANINDQSADRLAASQGGKLLYEPAPCDDGFAGVAPVGRLAPNAFGLHDTIGNVWEWIEDCYEMPYGATPVDGSAQLAKGCDRRGARGGAWRSDYPRQRPAFRGRDPEALTSQLFGTRIARDLD